MNYRILFFVFIIFGCKNNVEEQPIIEMIGPTLFECDSMKKKAETDYKNGIKEYIILGTVYATEFEMYYSDFMKQNYNITIKANCIPTFLDECYAHSMSFEIEEEYGEDFMKLTRAKAEKEFIEKLSIKNLLNNKSSKYWIVNSINGRNIETAKTRIIWKFDINGKYTDYRLEDGNLNLSDNGDEVYSNYYEVLSENKIKLKGYKYKLVKLTKDSLIVTNNNYAYILVNYNR